MPAIIASAAPLEIGATVLPVLSIGLDAGIVSELSHHSGQQYPTLVAISGAGPRITVQIPLRAAFDVIGLGVLRATACNLYLTKFSALIKSAGSTHTKWALAASGSAAIHITGISVTQDGIVVADVEIVPLSPDGTTAPLVKTDNNALPTLASQPTLHTLGPVSIGGTVYPGVTATSVELAPGLDVQRQDGAPYPSIAARLTAQPSIVLTHADPITMNGLLGATGLTGAVIAYFRQYDATTGVVGTANAISLTIATARSIPEQMQVAHGQVATVGVRVFALSSTDTHPIAVATGATAPALP